MIEVKNKLWLVSVHGYWYDEHDAFVVSAPSEKRARELANEAACSDQKEVWLDEMKSDCEEVTLDKEGVVLGSFNAG